MIETKINKLELYDLLKTVGCVLVVLGHVMIMYTASGAIDVNRESVFLGKIAEYVYVFHMPMFVMISGCVYGHCIEQGKYQNKIKFVWSKTKRLLIPYLVFGVFYVAPVIKLLHLTERSFLGYVKEAVFLSHNPRHLWYLLALYLLFVLNILLRPWMEKGKQGILMLFFISVVLLVVRKHLPTYLQLQNASMYQIFFCLGIVVNRYYKKIEEFLSKTTYLGPVCMATVTGIWYFNPNIVTSHIYKCIGIMMMMYLAWYLLSKKPDIRRKSWYVIIQKNSFGIYLFHPMIIYILFYLFRGCSINPIALSCLILVIAFLTSILFTEVTRRIGLKRILGE